MNKQKHKKINFYTVGANLRKETFANLTEI